MTMHPIFLSFILPSHLCLVSQMDPSGFVTKILYAILISHVGYKSYPSGSP